MPSDNKLDFACLGESNYSTWVGDIRALLQKSKCWGIISSCSPKPAADKPVLLDQWLAQQEEAAGCTIWPSSICRGSMSKVSKKTPSPCGRHWKPSTL